VVPKLGPVPIATDSLIFSFDEIAREVGRYVPRYAERYVY
jgi:hypothetical protein